MRTTLTLEDDVARLLEEEVHRQRKPMKQVVNEALRRGLRAGAGAEADLEPYQVNPHRTRLKSGVDPAALNRLVEELEDEDLQENLGDRG